ncbi:RNA polymerase sigma factor [Hamadaea tsunoensis]|uniref:RNA polymerase sigma factor n=1 Tax=Hamadaea tsunoensis TaxID=53368 RepID=UPI000402F03D|nr:hypothetical protein [Hamadaea tsunoensis]
MAVGDGVLAQLVARTSRGDTVAFAALYGILLPKIRAYAWRLTGGDAGLAELVTTGVFVEMWHLAGHHAGCEVSAWAQAIARRRTHEQAQRDPEATAMLSDYDNHIARELAELLADGDQPQDAGLAGQRRRFIEHPVRTWMLRHAPARPWSPAS